MSTTEKKYFSRKTKNTTPQDSYGRLQPQELELEKAVLGALLIEKDAYSVISEILTPESFYDPRHQLIFEAIRKLNIEQKPLDLLTVSEQLRATQRFEESGGPAYLALLTQNVVSSIHIEYHARVIAQKATARQLISYTKEI